MGENGGNWEREIKHMVGSSNSKLLEKAEWIVEWVLPGLFALILLACLTHLGYCVLQGNSLPSTGFQYAISAFAS